MYKRICTLIFFDETGHDEGCVTIGPDNRINRIVDRIIRKFDVAKSVQSVIVTARRMNERVDESLVGADIDGNLSDGNH